MLSLIAELYSGLASIERRFFSSLSFLCLRPAARVISVGNLSMGGTGKTPILFELLHELATRRICVLSRGYRCPWERSLYRLVGKGPHPEIPVLLGKNRHHSAIMAEKLYAPELLLLDDGFQYRRLHKDLSIVLWDAMSTMTEARVVPLGRLREPVERLKCADVIFLTRCESAKTDQIDFWTDWLARQAPEKPVIQVKTVCEGLFDHLGNRFEIAEHNLKILAFSAIGRPESFYSQLTSLGGTISKKMEFRDHHRFTSNDLQQIAAAKDENMIAICTEKDACKISDEQAERLQLKVLRIRTVPVSGQTFTAELAAKGIKL
jgi:tetraacyldisaccharide 4'-kinase